MDKLTFYDYFPKNQVGRPRTTQINILRYLSRNGKTRRAEIARYFGKNNQEINDSIKKLVEQGLTNNYCDVCKIKIRDYDAWKVHKNNSKHKTILKDEQKNENIEKSKPVIILTKKGFEIAIDDPLENREYDFVKEKNHMKEIWPVITTTNFWNVLREIFHGFDDFNSIEKICNQYENKILGIFKENITPYYFKKCLSEFKENNTQIFLFGKNKQEEIFYDDLILKTIAHNKSLDVSKSKVFKQMEKSYKCNFKLFEKHFKKLLSKGILEKTSNTKQETFQITQLGLILLLHFLNTDSVFYSKPLPEFKKIMDSLKSSKKHDEKLFYKKFEMIRKKYAYLLPLILEKSNFQRLNLRIIGFLKIFDELYFSSNDYGDFFGDHNFVNFRKFYEIRDIDFGRKLHNYSESYPITKIPFDELSKHMTKSSKSKKSINLRMKLLESEAEYRNSLVHIKNEFDRVWGYYYSSNRYFDRYHDKTDQNYSLREDLSIRFKTKIMESIENKITFDFYSLFGKYNKDFDVPFNNPKIEKWYEIKLEQLSKYVSHYFDKMLF